MITYIQCSQVKNDLVYNAFKKGYSDYIIKIELSKEDFFERFFGPEGNTLSDSFIALDNNQPIGLILGGIREYEGIKTMRCGGFCVTPDYRGKGIAQELFKLHKENAVKNNCKQLFLEVISSNNRAINFYKKQGYVETYQLHYYTLTELEYLSKSKKCEYNIKSVELDDIRTLRQKAGDVHINWQNDIDYLEKLKSQFNFGVYDKDKLIGGISISKNGNISFIWVDWDYRRKGVGTSLLKHSITELNLEILRSSFPNNALLQGYYKHIGFEKAAIWQHEMYLTL